ncbi:MULTISPECIES: hypothetical protein [Pseudomonas]|uniref:hypothetical protein n=1 Tax=Pseudomonas TaxID=286 RepID=UPI001E2C483B|nr:MULTISPECIES: hypothetical protein [Pseudomonas]MCK1867767.1 hypothetical protein [Pseudomonas aeruginosa]MCK1877353.1 hypothetical protein [Pseudomonas aeruginosa]MCK1885209.1 hypothetical protein [Pseudomonas aeruginosa]MCT5016997.1 hypothetical protein [Pseudomonas aeruginosa]UFH27670.1 hypothetical protein LMH93_03375 [Pseudomonas sp. CIP-10]
MISKEQNLFEIDFSVPVQQFRIEYTLVEKGGLPLVPEYILRLLKVSALTPADIALYFGFTLKEVSTALLQFLQQGELKISQDGRVALTEKGMRMFSGDEDTPVVKGRMEYRRVFTLDLLAYSFTEHAKHRLESPRCSVVLSASPSKRADSTTEAEQAFQRNLSKIYRSGELTGKPEDSQTPELYKISEVNKKKDGFIRFSESYCFELDTLRYGFSERAGLPQEDAYISQRSQQLANLIGQCNTESVMSFAEKISDIHTLTFLADGVFDPRKAAQAQAATRPGQSRVEPIYGALQLTHNWDRVEALLSKYGRRFATDDNKQPATISWLAPSTHGLWGKCSRHGQALSAFACSAVVTIAGKEKLVFEPKVLIPLADQFDGSAMNRAYNECKEAEAYLHGFIESDILSSVEIMTLSNSFAIVMYHLVQPDRHPVPIPFGFVTEDLVMVRKVEAVLEDTLAEYTAGNVSRYIGVLPRSTQRPRQRV